VTGLVNLYRVLESGAVLALLQHLLQHLHGYTADPVLLPAPSRAERSSGVGCVSVGLGASPWRGFGRPMAPLGSPPAGWHGPARGCQEKWGAGVGVTPGSGCTAPLPVRPRDRRGSGAAHGEEQRRAAREPWPRIFHRARNRRQNTAGRNSVLWQRLWGRREEPGGCPHTGGEGPLMVGGERRRREGINEHGGAGWAAASWR